MKKITMQRLVLILPLIFASELGMSADEQLFVEKLLSTMYTEDNSIYRSLLHPTMSKCANRMWIQKTGSAPTKYEYSISDVSQRTISNEIAMASAAGVKDAAFMIKPTHELTVTYELNSEYPPGHPCQSGRSVTFNALMVRDTSDWKITAVCVSQESERILTERKAMALEGKEKRAIAVEALFDKLSGEQQIRYEKLLSENKVTSINIYAKELGVDLATAYAFRDRLCSAYKSR